MAFVKVIVEWRRGVNGDQGTYRFYPNPTLARPIPGKRTAVLTIPLLDGAVVQNFGSAIRTLDIEGVLINKSNSWDEMETLRNNLISGISIGPGQLHLISPQRHVRYDAQVTTEGIQLDPQERTNTQDYTVSFIIPNATEINVGWATSTQTLNSDAEVI